MIRLSSSFVRLIITLFVILELEFVLTSGDKFLIQQTQPIGQRDNIALVVPNNSVSIASVSKPNLAQSDLVPDVSSQFQGLFANHWMWNSAPPFGSKTDGNWGLKAMRVPQLWNLNDAVQQVNHPTTVGIIDAGFQDEDGDGMDDHADLANVLTFKMRTNGQFVPGAIKSAHGQHVAGIIGATYNNGLGIDGIDPFSKIVAVSPVIQQKEGPWTDSWIIVLKALKRLLETHPEIRIVNVSMAYNWPLNTFLKVNSNTDESAHQVAQQQGIIMRQLAARFSKVLFIVAAGNDSQARFGYPNEILAKWASPLGWAALGPEVRLPLGNDSDNEEGGFVLPPSSNILVIEAHDGILQGETVYRKTDLSNVGGHLSAPGGRILSTVLNDEYDTLDGTSMAAPHVAGLAAYLLSFDPTLTVKEIKTLLLQSAKHVADEPNGQRGPNGEGPAPRVDAFDTILGLDTLRQGNPVQRALVDVAHCVTSVAIEPCGVELGSDGKVDIADFLAFRRALWQIEGRLPVGVTPWDLNGDGCIHELKPQICPTMENIYPRFDFNGDGKLNSDTKAPFKGEFKTDLEVLLKVWKQGATSDIDGIKDDGVKVTL